jgi:hypothetical protein
LTLGISLAYALLMKPPVRAFTRARSPWFQSGFHRRAEAVRALSEVQDAVDGHSELEASAHRHAVSISPNVIRQDLEQVQDNGVSIGLNTVKLLFYALYTSHLSPA